MDLDDEKSLALEQRKILLFNCSEIVDFSSGDTILPTRITCYCRHHNEKVGFCIIFVMKDCSGQVIARGVSPAIMITDDHKSSKTKQANGVVGRRRSRVENERRGSHSKLADRTAERTGDRSIDRPNTTPISISTLSSNGSAQSATNIFAQARCFGLGTSGKQKRQAIKQEPQIGRIVQGNDEGGQEIVEEDGQIGLKVENERQTQQIQTLGGYSTSPSTPLSPISPSSPRPASAPYHIPAKYDRNGE
ncbi:2708_t:CDS:1 [Paraglomus occultum]|uniref:2708_t:CDS:1 n=1 Tax=Paraglomus occultum TaxID=144539 RepID=A0A9N9FNQ5_9GLOM|nr:2708_t:CDS:1 [Paraglomus occultum]